MARDPHTQLATRRIGADRIGAGAAPGAGAVDEYLALQGAAVGRLIGCGVEASAAAGHMRAEAHHLVRDSGLVNLRRSGSRAPNFPDQRDAGGPHLRVVRADGCQ